MAYTQLSNISRALVLGVHDWFTANFDAYAVQYPQFCKVVTSTLETEKYDSMANLAPVTEMAEGANFAYGNVEQAYETQVQNKKFGGGIQFTLESMAYDKYKLTVEAKAKELIHIIRDKEEELGVKAYNEAFTVNLADGVPLCDNSHPLFNVSGTNDTLTTGALTPDNVKVGVQMFSQFKNHQGKPMRAFPNQLMTHEYNMITVEEILMSQNKAYEFSNTENKLPPLRAAYSRYLTSTTAWFLRDTRFDHSVLQFYQGHRNKMDWDEDFENKNLKGTIYFLGNAAGLPRPGIVGSLGT